MRVNHQSIAQSFILKTVGIDVLKLTFLSFTATSYQLEAKKGMMIPCVMAKIRLGGVYIQ